MKMKYIFTWILMVSGVFLILGACDMFSAPIGEEPIPVEDANRGSFTIKVQAVSPVLRRLIAENPAKETYAAATARAYMGAGKVHFRVEDGSASVVMEWDNLQMLSLTYHMTNLDDEVRTLPVGNYTLYAEVYNNPSDETYTVGGSKEFTVSSGDVEQVIVTCLPNQYTDLEEESPAELLLPQVWMLDEDMQVSQIGSEAWFRVVPSTVFTDFYVIPDETQGGDSAPALILFDGEGHALGGIQADGPGMMASLQQYPTQPEEVYWVGVADFGVEESGDRYFHVSYSAVPAPEPIPIESFGEYIEGEITEGMRDVWYSFQTSSEGHIYKINWDDGYMSSETYTLDIEVSAYTGLDQQEPYFEYQDSGYYSGSNVYAPANETVYIKIVPYTSDDSGTFAIMVTDLGIPELPDPPDSIEAYSFYPGVEIEWSASEFAESYNLYWAQGTEVTTETGTMIQGIEDTYFEVENLSAGVTYAFIVTAVNSVGESAPTEVVTAVPEAVDGDD